MRAPDLLRLTRFFTAVVAEGHFGRAADRLEIAQPSLSQGLQRLERVLGLTLVTRGPRGVDLTAAGAALLPAARRLLDAEADLLGQAREHAAAATAVRLGIDALVPVHLVAALAGAVEAGAPKAGVAVSTAPTTAMIDAVAAGRLDYAVTLHPAVLAGLAAGDVVHLRADLLLPQALAPALGQRVRVRDLIARPLARLPREHAPAAYDLTTDTLRAHGVTAPTLTVQDERAALALVAAGQACTLTADPHLRAAGVARRAVPGDVLALRLRVAWPPTARGARADLGHRLTAAITPAPSDGGSSEANDQAHP